MSSSDPADRIELLRRKIAALEVLASDPGSTVAESQSAQETANKLRLELSKLLREAKGSGGATSDGAEGSATAHRSTSTRRSASSSSPPSEPKAYRASTPQPSPSGTGTPQRRTASLALSNGAIVVIVLCALAFLSFQWWAIPIIGLCVIAYRKRDSVERFRNAIARPALAVMGIALTVALVMWIAESRSARRVEYAQHQRETEQPQAYGERRPPVANPLTPSAPAPAPVTVPLPVRSKRLGTVQPPRSVEASPPRKPPRERAKLVAEALPCLASLDTDGCLTAAADRAAASGRVVVMYRPDGSYRGYACPSAVPCEPASQPPSKWFDPGLLPAGRASEQEPAVENCGCDPADLMCAMGCSSRK